jgi:hypothetical protein
LWELARTHELNREAEHDNLVTRFPDELQANSRPLSSTPHGTLMAGSPK